MHRDDIATVAKSDGWQRNIIAARRAQLYIRESMKYHASIYRQLPARNGQYLLLSHRRSQRVNGGKLAPMRLCARAASRGVRR